jgi:hypothetical protein
MSNSSPIPGTVMAPPRPRRKWRWILIAIVLFVLIPASALVGWIFYSKHQAKLALEEAIAEADRLDPGWRLEDIEKRRTALPDKQNAAIHITAAMALLPGSILAAPDDQILSDVQEFPQHQIDAELAEKLRKALQPLMPAESHIRKAAELKTGAYPIQWAPVAISTILPHIQDTRKVAIYLTHLAILQSQDGKHSEAWQTALSVLAVSRSLGDEPHMLSALVRTAIDNIAVRDLERCLAQGRVPDDLLAEAQRQLRAESLEPIFVHGLRGERAAMHSMMTKLENGSITLGDILGSNNGPPAFVFFMVTGSSAEKDHIWMLKWYNEAVASAQLPAQEMRLKFAALQQKINSAPKLSKMFVPAIVRLGESSSRSKAWLECAIAGIGAERFRLANGRWPESLDEVLAAKLIDKLPIDHFDGKPLRYRKASEGVVVYSIGDKGTYAGDALDAGKTPDPSLHRIEFRLWDEDQRRQPPRPAVKTKSDDER